MGYSYDRRSGKIACDNCGSIEGVRKRTCPHKVNYMDGGSLPYCPAPALCSECFRKFGSTQGIHARCAEPARQANKEQTSRKFRLLRGDAELCARWGDWHEMVPEGKIATRYRYANGNEITLLLPADISNQCNWITDIPLILELMEVDIA